MGAILCFRRPSPPSPPAISRYETKDSSPPSPPAISRHEMRDDDVMMGARLEEVKKLTIVLPPPGIPIRYVTQHSNSRASRLQHTLARLEQMIHTASYYDYIHRFDGLIRYLLKRYVKRKRHSEADDNELNMILNEGLSCAVMRGHPYLAYCCILLDHKLIQDRARCRERLRRISSRKVREDWQDLMRYDHYPKMKPLVHRQQKLEVDWAQLYSVLYDNV